MPKSPDDAQLKTNPKKKRRWPKVLLVLLVLLVALGFAVNGPIARWAVGKILTDQLAKQGLDGQVTVEGQLWSGFTLKDASFEGEGSIAKIKFDEVGVEYSLSDLRDKKIRRLHGGGVELELTLKEKKKERKKPEFEKIAESLRKIRPLVAPVELDLERFAITLNPPDDDKEPLRFSFDALDHQAGSPEFRLAGLSSNVLGENGLPAQDLTLTWNENDLAVSKVQVLPALALGQARVDYSPAQPLSLDASVQAAGAGLSLQADETGTIQINMSDGPLSIEEVLKPYKPDLELGGAISRLQVSVRNLWEDPDKWTARIDFDGKDFKLPGGGALTELSLRLTGDQDLNLAIRAANDLNLQATAPRPELAEQELAEIWKDLPVTIELTTPSLHRSLHDVFAAIGKDPIELANIPEGAIGIDGSITTGGEFGVQPANATWSFSNIVFKKSSAPNLQGTASLSEGIAKVTATLAQPRPEESFTVSADWTLESKKDDAKLSAKLPDPAWLLPFLPKQEDPLWKPTGPIDLAWTGNGALPKDAAATHAGTLEIAKLTLTAPEDTTTALALKGSYNWPGTIELSSFSARNADFKLDGDIKWAGERVSIGGIRLHDSTGPLARLSGSLPLTTETLAPKKFFAQNGPLDLSLESSQLRLRRLSTLLPVALPAGFAAALSAKLNIKGTPAKPLLDGNLTATEVDTPGPENLPLVAANIDFKTQNNRLTATGTVTEPAGRIVSLEASVPFEIDTLLNNPEDFKKLPIQARAKIDDFRLQRLQILSPALAEVVGGITSEIRVEGTIAEPKLAGGATVKLERYPIPGAPFEQIDDAQLIVRLDGDRIAIDPSPFNAAGGRLVLSGSVGLAEGKPQFDLQVDADSFLAWRDDNVLARIGGQLKLLGTLEQSRLSGNLGLVESLIYKDIEIIPRGIPAAGAPKPKLPTFKRDPGASLSKVPEPFANWTLDVAFKTTDPVLIRGNIATGRITANTRITGTLSNPRPEGVVNLDRVEAALPLSKLTVRQGNLTLRPNAPFDPVIDVRGTTTLNNHRISIYLFGPISDPKYDLFSEPPLPESEILTLIATGTTTGGLQDQDTATMKAFQFAITEAKRLLTKPGSDSLFQKFLKTLEVVDIRAGDNDPFQGRKFTSATLQVNEFLFLSAAVDREGQTRGVVMFAPQPDDPEARGLLEEPGGPKARLPSSKIRVVGLRSLKPEAALAAIAGRLEYIEDRPATPSRANDAAFLLERFLQQQGYTDPEVTWSLPQPGRILLAVKEGPRSFLGNITVEGTTGELADGVRAQMKSAHEDKARLLGTETPYLPEKTRTGLKHATDLLHSEGLWSGRVELREASRNSSGRTDLRLRVITGPRYNLAAPRFAPDTPFRDELLARLAFLKGRVAKTKNITLAENSVGRYYRDKGYQNAEIFMDAEHKAGITQLIFRVRLGKIFKVDQVTVAGLERTDPSIVSARFDQFEGDTYSREEFDDVIRKLFGTGAFAGIRLDEQTKDDGTIDVTLHLREGKPDGYQLYTGVGSFEGFIVGAGYYHRNLLGRLWNLSTRAEISGIGLLGEASVTDPFFLGYDLRFTPRAFLQTRTYEGYKKFESGAGVTLAWDINDYYSMELDWTTSIVTLNADGLPQSEIGPEVYLLNVLGLTQIYDRRNNLALPTDGYYATLTTEAGLSLGEGAISFLRADAQASVYEPVTEKSHVAVGVRAGMIVPSASSANLPVDLRYFLGGANSVRSFPARELGPEADNGLPRGGQSYWVANAEFVHTLIGPLDGVFFTDVGSLSRNHFEIFSGEIKYAAGIGLRLGLPIGAVRLEYGRSLNPAHNEPDGTFHFAIGAAF